MVGIEGYNRTLSWVLLLVLSGITGLACTTPPLAPTPTSAPTTVVVLSTTTPTPHVAIKTVALAGSTPVPPTTAPTAIPTPTPVPTPTPLPPMPRGVVDPAIEVTVYDPEKAWDGTTLLSDHHNPGNPRIIEVNMLGEVIWEYGLPEDFKRHTNPGQDVELISNGNILIVLPNKGIIEINRMGEIVWSHLDKNVSHDADRLPNGNTLYAYGAGDEIEESQAKEVSPEGDLVWEWHAKEHFNKQPYLGISEHGWTHANAVERLENGNTLVGLRNFDVLVEVDPKEKTVRTIGEGLLRHPHEPEVLHNGNILIADHHKPNEMIELDPDTNEIVWRLIPPYKQLGMELGLGKEATMKALMPIRDGDTLPNGNILMTGYGMILEAARTGEIVWQLQYTDMQGALDGWKSTGFYKAQRISSSTK